MPIPVYPTRSKLIRVSLWYFAVDSSCCPLIADMLNVNHLNKKKRLTTLSWGGTPIGLWGTDFGWHWATSTCPRITILTARGSSFPGSTRGLRLTLCWLSAASLRTLRITTRLCGAYGSAYSSLLSSVSVVCSIRQSSTCLLGPFTSTFPKIRTLYCLGLLASLLCLV